MKRPTPGKYLRVSAAGETFKAFVPAPLPPKPPLVWSSPLRRRGRVFSYQRYVEILGSELEPAS